MNPMRSWFRPVIRMPWLKQYNDCYLTRRWQRDSETGSDRRSAVFLGCSRRTASSITEPRSGPAQLMESDSDLRLLWLCSDLESSNGWGSYARGLAESLIARGVNLRILVSRHQTDSSLDGAEVIPCLTSAPRTHGPSDRSRLERVSNGALARRADLIHSIVEPYALGARTPGARGHIMTLHGTYAVSPFREGMLTRWAFAQLPRPRKSSASANTRSRACSKRSISRSVGHPKRREAPS